MAIVREIVSSHHGTVLAANNPDGGAVFTVRPPRLTKPASVSQEILSVLSG